MSGAITPAHHRNTVVGSFAGLAVGGAALTWGIAGLGMSPLTVAGLAGVAVAIITPFFASDSAMTRRATHVYLAALALVVVGCATAAIVAPLPSLGRIVVGTVTFACVGILGVVAAGRNRS